MIPFPFPRIKTIPISEMFSDLDVLEQAITEIKENTIDAKLTQNYTAVLEKYGNPRLSLLSLLLEELTLGIKKDAINDQRDAIIQAAESVSEINGLNQNKLSVSSEIIGFNGVMFRHLNPSAVPTPGNISSSSKSFAVKGFPTVSCDTQAEIQIIIILPIFGHLLPPGVYTIVSMAEDSSGNRVMSTPVSLTSTFGTSPPTVRMTSPQSGTQRSVTMVGEHASGQAIQISITTQNGTFNTGRIGGINLAHRGTGYVAPPTVHFFGSGFGAVATATIVDDPADPRYGQIDEITINNEGSGYYGDTVVEFRGGLGNEAVFLNALASDADGEINQVEFLVNGERLTTDLTEPFAMQSDFSVGYYEIVAVATDDAGNIVASEPSRLNVSTIRGAAPSGFIIYPLPPIAYQSYLNQGQDYFWGFVQDYSEIIQEQEQTLGNQVESFSLSSNSFIHLSARATDSDGEISEVTFYLNNKLLGKAERQHDSPLCSAC